jgi:HlyD family secretion protein
VTATSEHESLKVRTEPGPALAPAPVNRSRRRCWLWLLPVPLVVVVVAHLHGAVPAATVTASRGAVTQTVVASGRVLAPAKVQLAPLGRGRVARVPVLAGQHVSAGESLMELDDAEARAAVAQAEAQLARARARIGQLSSRDARVAEAQVQRAESELATAEAEHRRTSALVDSGAMPRAQLDGAETALARAREQRDGARVRLADALPTGGEGRLAAAGVLEARAQLRATQVRLAQARIVAPAAGTVLRRDVEVGDVVDGTRALMILAIDGATRLSIQPDERALGAVRVGQRARASSEAFPGDSFDARVEWISPAVDDSRGTVEIRLLVDSPPSYLRPDMTVSVTVMSGERADALVVPVELIRDLAGAAPYVLVRRDGQEERRPVRLGLRSSRDVEIVEGVAEGEQIVPPPTSAQGARQKIHPWD